MTTRPRALETAPRVDGERTGAPAHRPAWPGLVVLTAYVGPVGLAHRARLEQRIRAHDSLVAVNTHLCCTGLGAMHTTTRTTNNATGDAA
jgi:hypothetical protein